MDKIIQHHQNAIREIQTAAYLLSTTYKLIKEPKTLLPISEHVFDSFMSSVSALLLFERNKKTIQPYHDNSESKLNAFKKLAKKYDLQNYINTIEEIMNLAKEHKKSSVEFTKDGKYVLCSQEFKRINTVSETDVRNYIKTAREFITHVERLTAHE
jgi:hypothetical protein